MANARRWVRRWRDGGQNNRMTTIRRPRWALFILLGVVLTVTMQILSGFLLSAGMHWIFSFHVADGLAAGVLIMGEWGWLLATPQGHKVMARMFLFSTETRHQLGRQIRGEIGFSASFREGLDAPVQGLFLIFASITVVIGILLWQRHGGYLPWHRVLAVILLVLWLLHLTFSIHDHWRRRGPDKGVPS